MTFDEALTTQAQWIQIWIMFMGVVILGSIVVLLFSKATRLDAAIIAIAMVAVYPAMLWFYGQVGFVRLLGIVHIIFWVPLVIHLIRRLRDAMVITPFRQVIWLLLATLLISLAFDVSDVVRYLLGERASMVPSG